MTEKALKNIDTNKDVRQVETSHNLISTIIHIISTIIKALEIIEAVSAN